MYSFVVMRTVGEYDNTEVTPLAVFTQAHEATNAVRVLQRWFEDNPLPDYDKSHDDRGKLKPHYRRKLRCPYDLSYEYSYEWAVPRYGIVDVKTYPTMSAFISLGEKPKHSAKRVTDLRLAR